MTSRERVVKALRFMIPMWAPMPNPFERMQHLRGSEQLFLDLWRPFGAENLGYARYPGRCPGLTNVSLSGLELLPVFDRHSTCASSGVAS